MSCGSLMFRHGLLLIAALFSGVPFLTSSTDCTCPPSQNARCLKQAGKCTLVCHEGYWGNTCEFGRIRWVRIRVAFYQSGIKIKIVYWHSVDGLQSFLILTSPCQRLSTKRKIAWFKDIENEEACLSEALNFLERCSAWFCVRVPKTVLDRS